MSSTYDYTINPLPGYCFTYTVASDTALLEEQDRQSYLSMNHADLNLKRCIENLTTVSAQANGMETPALDTAVKSYLNAKQAHQSAIACANKAIAFVSSAKQAMGTEDYARAVVYWAGRVKDDEKISSVPVVIRSPSVDMWP